MLSKAVSSEDHNNPGELVLCLLFLQFVMTVVVRMMIRKRPWSLLVSRAHAFISTSILPGNLWALAGCFPQTIVNVIFLCLQVLLHIGDIKSDVIVILTST